MSRRVRPAQGGARRLALRAPAVYLIDVDSGDTAVAVQEASVAEWSADGSKLFYWKHAGEWDDEKQVLTERDMESGEERPVRAAGRVPSVYRGFGIEPLPCTPAG